MDGGQQIYQIRPTFGNAPPWQRDVGQEGIQWRRLLTPMLLPEVKRLRESTTCPQWIVGTIVQFWKIQKNIYC